MRDPTVSGLDITSTRTSSNCPESGTFSMLFTSLFKRMLEGSRKDPADPAGSHHADEVDNFSGHCLLSHLGPNSTSLHVQDRRLLQ